MPVSMKKSSYSSYPSASDYWIRRVATRLTFTNFVSISSLMLQQTTSNLLSVGTYLTGGIAGHCIYECIVHVVGQCFILFASPYN